MMKSPIVVAAMVWTLVALGTWLFLSVKLATSQRDTEGGGDRGTSMAPVMLSAAAIAVCVHVALMVAVVVSSRTIERA